MANQTGKGVEPGDMAAALLCEFAAGHIRNAYPMRIRMAVRGMVTLVLPVIVSFR